MGSYVANTEKQQREMLETLGLSTLDELFSEIPGDVKLEGALDLPDGLSEMETIGRMREMAEKNRVFRTMLRGAGAYRHYIPSIVKSIPAKEEFLTAYTPYQAEISQGILQSIFEYQTMLCELTGMDVSNACVYDGATAAAEAAAMCRDRKRSVVYLSATSHPQVIDVVKTYCFGNGMEVRIVPEKNGHTDQDALSEMMNAQAACFYVQQPNFYGQLEDCAALSGLAHEAGAKFIMGINPIAASILPTPAECGADIAVGEGQPLGMPLGFGGPYMGFMTASASMGRKLPGRIVGETTDVDGKRGYVLTLQAREQHIRREKASSNICSNEALCALTASVYLAAMGADGLKNAAVQCSSKAHYLAERLSEAGLTCKYDGEFFHEFVTAGEKKAKDILSALEQEGILGGLPLSEHEILWCATELNTKKELDRTAEIVKEVRS